MKNFVKLIPMYALTIFAYFWIITAFIDIESDIFYTVTACVLFALWLVNLIYSVLTAVKMKAGGRSFLVAVLVCKLLLVPLFVMFIVMGAFAALGIFIAPMFAVLMLLIIPVMVLFSYAFVLASAAYAVGEMVKFYKNNKSPYLFALTLVCCVCQFIFVADVISLFVYLLLAAKTAAYN